MKFKALILLAVILGAVVYVTYSLGSHSAVLPAAPVTSWQPPRYPEVNVFIRRHDLAAGMGTEGSTGTPNLHLLTPDVHSKFTYEWGDAGKIPYQTEIEYLGRATSGDRYRISYSIPIENGSQTVEKEIVFGGAHLEFYRDAKYVIGMEPHKI